MNYNYYDNLGNFNGISGVDNLLDDNYLNQKNNSLNFNQGSNQLSLYEPLEGYARGNLFKNLYDSYKNYRPQKLSINSEQEELLVSIGEYSFAAHDLNLYLDINPNDQNALNIFNRYYEQAQDLIKQYERKYGPLTVSASKTPFAWEASSWPWEV